ncbi:MAG: serine/threonine-protein kinase, partial [Verrucomicrobia bacterium]|nr:serine/threonine-protein kinase [Verrucomicrobiota bacterium]
MKDRYDIKGKIGQGGIGAVYSAWDKRLNRDVAIKRVLPEGGFENEDEAIAHLLKEATALSSVQHPHIVTVYDAGVDDDGPYVVMELLAGRTLDQMIEQGTLLWADFREVAIQSQEALIAAQDLNLVHRDLKPTNVMVVWLASGKFQIKIVDFGLAKFSPKPSLQTIDHGDAVFGSIHFMAPEQFERDPLDQRTDMYAMGCLYYYCLTGLYPFGGESAPAVMAAHLNHLVTPLQELRQDLPVWVCDWVMWHISRNMDDRPNNARQSLQKFLMNEQQDPAPEESSQAPAERPKFVFPGAATGPAPTPQP